MTQVEPTQPTPVVQTPVAPVKASVITNVANSQPAVFAFLITIIGVIGAIILVAMNKTVPDPLWQITGGAGLIGGGALTLRA